MAEIYDYRNHKKPKAAWENMERVKLVEKAINAELDAEIAITLAGRTRKFDYRGRANKTIVARINGLPATAGTLETDRDPCNPNVYDTAPSEYVAPSDDCA